IIKIKQQMKKNLILFHIFFLFITYAFCIPKGDVPELQERVTDDAAWCWFSDPRAIYHKGQYEKVYYGYINSKGDVKVNSYDLQTGEEEEFILHPELQIDDHNVPTFLFLPDGKLLTFYNHHN